MMELASRDVTSRAEQTEINEGRDVDGCVLLDLRHLGKEKIHARLSYINEVSMDFLGIDLAEEPVPVCFARVQTRQLALHAMESKKP